MLEVREGGSSGGKETAISQDGFIGYFSLKGFLVVS
jgi:hypothetical protein